jgi:ABC-2 type transport system permease protein
MRNAWIIASREYRQYFQSSVAYIIAFLIMLISGVFFVAYVYSGARSAIGGSYSVYVPSTSDIVVSPTALILLFTAGIFTMRLLSDENRTGTLELLLTAPIRDGELVVGKWLGAMLYMLTVFGFSFLTIPLVLNRFVEPGIDWGVTLSGYLGLILFTSATLSIGTAFSSFFKNQFAAAACTFFTLLIFWWIIGIPASLLPNAAETLNYFNIRAHLNDMMKGVITLKDVVYYLSLTALGLFLATAATEMRRWQ